MVFHTGPVYGESQDLLEGDLEIQLLSDYFDEKKYGNSTLISTFRITYNDSYNCENRLPELLAAGNNAIQELEIANEAHILKHDFGYYLAMILGACKRGGYQKFCKLVLYGWYFASLTLAFSNYSMPPVVLDKLKHLVLNDMDLVDKGLTQLSPSFPFLDRMEFFGCKFIDETNKEAKVGFTLDMRNTSIGTLVFTESKNESPPSGLSFEVNNIRQNLLISVSSEVQGFTRYYISIGGKGSVKQVDMDQFESSLHD